ncbi:hypothetical protein LL06_21090 [Hoeflea sp. BAL378]|uniref:EF-hand domain-containing protein n=1 Tax=Hoeflea sp. BAL378 TaxID=1547437 RepID=UPI000513AF9C|nr:EF-hand domain-containing protein [Hoeflea sp. BAL378]KGF67605.1 hypothetical protein LL06_21090 [Hoeflea sp. BAL378]
MKKLLLTALAAALVASVAAPAMAAQRGDGPRKGPPVARMMERFDANRDGIVLPEEISAHRQAMFQAVDTDKSGTLSETELKAFGEQRMEMRQKNREERRAERDAGKGDMKGKPGDRDGRMAGKHDGKGRDDRRGGMRMERIDADKNGEISLQEFTAVDSKMFERFDRNGDKKIDITDFYRERADNN